MREPPDSSAVSQQIRIGVRIEDSYFFAAAAARFLLDDGDGEQRATVSSTASKTRVPARPRARRGVGFSNQESLIMISSVRGRVMPSCAAA